MVNSEVYVNFDYFKMAALSHIHVLNFFILCRTFNKYGNVQI